MIIVVMTTVRVKTLRKPLPADNHDVLTQESLACAWTRYGHQTGPDTADPQTGWLRPWTQGACRSELHHETADRGLTKKKKKS